VRRFLLAYWLYKDGVNTIIVFSGIYASVTLAFTGSELVFLYLLVQITAMIGSIALSTPTDRWGAKKVVVLSLFLWIAVTVGAYLVVDKRFFWGIAVMAGLGLGSVQAASRALFFWVHTSGHGGGILWCLCLYRKDIGNNRSGTLWYDILCYRESETCSAFSACPVCPGAGCPFFSEDRLIPLPSCIPPTGPPLKCLHQ